MRLFRKKKGTITRMDSPLLIRITDAIHRRQLQVAGYLNRKTQYWNRTSKLTALLVFCLLFGGCCLLLVLKAIIH
jgi:hypothetical protein